MLKQKFILNSYHYEVEVKAMCKLLFVPHWILTQSKQYQSKTTYYLLHIFIWIVAVITWIVTQKETYLTSKCILNEKLAVYFLNLISFAIYFAIKKIRSNISNVEKPKVHYEKENIFLLRVYINLLWQNNDA